MNGKSYAGDVTFEISPEMELYMIVCSSIMQPTYYVPNTNDITNKIKTLINKVNHEFVAKLAVYARETMNLRTIGQVLIAELAKVHSGDNLVRKATKRVIGRADEIVSLMEYYLKANSRKIPHKNTDKQKIKRMYKLSNQLKKGIADSFTKFNEYQFSKYYGNDTGDIKIQDIMFLTHPEPNTPEMAELFDRIANKRLDTAYTHEVERTKAGQTGRSMKEVNEELILSGKMGYMALLRNLGSFMKSGVDSSILSIVLDKLADPDEIAKSKQFPFRFYSAYKSLFLENNDGLWNSSYNTNTETENHLMAPIIKETLEKAIKLSVKNSPIKESDKVLIASDVSGSMYKPISTRSSIYYYEIGVLLSMLMKHHCLDSTVGIFGDTWMVLNDELNGREVIKNSINSIKMEGKVGYSTNAYKVLDWVINRNESYDRVMFFTDGQFWSNGQKGRLDKLWKQYKKNVPNAKLYLFVFAPYGQANVQIDNNDTFIISGWSDHIFNILDNVENGETVLADIKRIQL